MIYIPKLERKCKCCGAKIDMTFKDIENYAYKLRSPRNYNKWEYYCSYSCLRKVQKEREDTESRKAKAKLLNKYHGCLTLQECEIVEGMMAYMAKQTIKNIHITTREDYDKFMRKYRKYYRLLFS